MGEIRKYRVPGRINFIGEHTDYNLGFVLPGAVDLGLNFTVEILGGQEHVFYSGHFDQEDRCGLAGEGLQREWSVFFKQVLQLVEEKGHQIRGIRCEFDGNLPVGAGMSSSSAITCGLIYILNDCFALGLELMDIVLLASEAERGSGLDGGKMDQYAITFGEKDTLLLLDCRTLEHEDIIADFGAYELILMDTKVSHSLVDSGYNDRHNDCKRGLKAVQEVFTEVSSIRDITYVMLASDIPHLDDVSRHRMSYVIDENARVKQAQAALSVGDMKALGDLLYASHTGLQEEYNVSCDELDFIVDWTKGIDDFSGARMMGGGFGGCVIALVKSGTEVIHFNRLSSLYNERFGHMPSYYPVRLSEGIHRVS